MDTKQRGFDDPFAGGYFFWPAFTNRWIELLELYEITLKPRYLQAAHDGARRYAQFCWMSPRVPDSNIRVNEDGKAPMYWYLKSKGHKQMYFPEESVPAWRVSEIGLTPESSGTSTGHRAIFMANYAPWMLRLGYYTNDTFLQEIAKDAIVGRYRNFPGYHMNTERTTAYEKADYPLRSHEELSVNSFHYNHIMPMISMLLDYLITDAYVKSDGRIDFPSEYIEGYAYLQNKMYGHRPGTFGDDEGVQLWMPTGLVDIDHVELNYISARKGNKLYLAFMNQSDEHVAAHVQINDKLVRFPDSSKQFFTVEVAAGGIETVIFEHVRIDPLIQDKLVTATNGVLGNDYLEIQPGNAKAMLMRLGKAVNSVYLYLSDDESRVQAATVTYTDLAGRRQIMIDTEYPYEFTIPLDAHQEGLRFELEVKDPQGRVTCARNLQLGIAEE